MYSFSNVLAKKKDSEIKDMKDIHNIMSDIDEIIKSMKKKSETVNKYSKTEAKPCP